MKFYNLSLVLATIKCLPQFVFFNTTFFPIEIVQFEMADPVLITNAKQ